MKDLHSGLSVVAVMIAASNANNAPVAIDLQGFNSAEIVLLVGIGGITFTGTNKVEFKLTHSDDDATYDAVDAGDVLGVTTVGTGGIVKFLTSAHPDPASYRIGYVGGRRYVKLLADFSGTHGTATPIGAMVIKGHPSDSPVADQA